MRVEIYFEPRDAEASVFINDHEGRMQPLFSIPQGLTIHLELGAPLESIWFHSRGGRVESYSRRRPT
jgi:hypothetical protein